MPLPLLQVVGQNECQRVPRGREVDWDVPLDAPLADQLQHADLCEHGDAVDPVDKAVVLERGAVFDHIPSALPHEDGSNLLPRPDHLERSILLLLHSRHGHAHVVRDLGQRLLTPDLVIHGAHPVHVAQDRLQDVYDGLGVFRGDVVRALELGLHETTAVDVARKVGLCPAEEGLGWHVPWEAWVLLHSPPRPGMAVYELLGIERKPSRTLVGLVLPLLVGEEGALQVLWRLDLLLLLLLLVFHGGHLPRSSPETPR
mmetsp:Transcript_12917/g.40767  ORF Transcript_12917/g.40767 Transcript_12917/m.40767 type:complete len:257 (-) Transcript_12917:46-816(-)